MTKLPTRFDRKTIFCGRRFSFYADAVEMPNGNRVDPFYFLDFGFSAVAVIVENDEHSILLEEVARYPTQSITWELPIGIIEENESMLDAAKREVHEETGYDTVAHKHIQTYAPMSGISNMKVHIVHCDAREQTGQPNPNEVMRVRWFSPHELTYAIAQGDVTDGFTLTGLLLHLGINDK